MSGTDLFIIIIVGLLVVFMFFSTALAHRCVKCGKWWAIKKMDSFKEVPGFLGSKTFRLVKCKFCGEEEWKRKKPFRRSAP